METRGGGVGNMVQGDVLVDGEESARGNSGTGEVEEQTAVLMTRSTM